MPEQVRGVTDVSPTISSHTKEFAMSANETQPHNLHHQRVPTGKTSTTHANGKTRQGDANHEPNLPTRRLDPSKEMGTLNQSVGEIQAQQEHRKAYTEQEHLTQRKELEAENQLLRVEVEKFRSKWMMACTKLNQVEQIPNDKLPDDYLIREMRGLRYEISSWSEQFYGGRLRDPRRVSEWKEEAIKDLNLGNLVEDIRFYVYSDELRPALIQACVWQRLHTHLFGINYMGGFFWTKTNKETRSLYRSLWESPGIATEQELKEFHLWRSMTARLLQRCLPSGERHQRCGSVAKRLVEDLEPLESAREGEPLAALLSLVSIVEHALALDEDFHRQRAAFKIVAVAEESRHYGFAMDPTFCEARPAGPVVRGQIPLINLLQSRGLEKIGTSDGHHYGESTILLKCEVLTTRPSLQYQQLQSASMLSTQFDRAESPARRPIGGDRSSANSRGMKGGWIGKGKEKR